VAKLGALELVEIELQLLDDDIAGFELVLGILQGGCLFSQLCSLLGNDRLQGCNVVRKLVRSQSHPWILPGCCL